MKILKFSVFGLLVGTLLLGVAAFKAGSSTVKKVDQQKSYVETGVKTGQFVDRLPKTGSCDCGPGCDCGDCACAKPGALLAGTEVLYDEGTFTTKVVVVGKEDWHTARTMRRSPLLVAVREGDKPPYDGFYLLDPKNLGKHKILKIGKGELEEVVPNVGISEEPLAMLDEPLVEVQLQPEKVPVRPQVKPTKPPVVAPPTCADGSCTTTVSDSGDEEGRGKGRIRAWIKRHIHRRGGEGRGGCGIRGRLRGGC